MTARDEFLKDLLDTAVGGVQYWANVTIYRPFAGEVELTDDGGNPHTVTTQTLKKGIEVARQVGLGSMSGREYVEQWWEAERTNGRDGDYDADIADQIVQLGLFEKVVYG